MSTALSSSSSSQSDSDDNSISKINQKIQNTANNIPTNNNNGSSPDALDAFAALEHRVQTLQPTISPTTTTFVMDEDDDDDEGNNYNQEVAHRIVSSSKRIHNNHDDNNYDDDEAYGSTERLVSSSAALPPKGRNGRAAVVKIITPTPSTTTFYSAQDSNIIVTAENDDDAVMILGNGSNSSNTATNDDDNDDDDVEFIVHDDLEPKTSSAVAAALDLHEKKARGIATYKARRKKNTSHGTNSLVHQAGDDDFEDDHDEHGGGRSISGAAANSSLSSSSSSSSTSKKKQKNWIQKRMSQLLPKGGLVSSAANVSAATLGSSALIIAYCFQRSAIVPGSLVLICNMGFTVYTIWLLMRMLDRLGEESYEGVANRICGKKFGKSAALCVAFFGWGCAAVYAAVLKSVLATFVPMVLPDDGTTFLHKLSPNAKEQVFAAVVGLVTQVPLALKEEMNSLRFVSTVGTFSIIVLVISVVHHAIREDPNITSARVESRIITPLGWNEMFQTMGIFVFSYCCQTNTFPIYEEMADRSAYRMSLASVLALTVCTLFYIIVGVSGLAAFGPDVTDNIVKNFIMDGSTSTDAILCCVSVGITVLGSFSVSLLPAREAILEAFGYDKNQSYRLGLGIFLAISALILGIISPGLVTICSVVGGAVGTWISYIFPVYLTYSHGELLNPSSPYFGWKHVVMCSIVMICGAGVGAVGSVLSIVHALS